MPAVALFKRLWPCLALAALALIPLVFELPGHWSWVRSLQNAGHCLLFAAMGLLLLGRWPRQWLLIALGLVALGAAIEVIQAFTGRDCNWADLLLDAQGVAAALAWHAAARVRPGSKVWLIVLRAAAVGLLLAALASPFRLLAGQLLLRHQFPLLEDFRSPWTAAFFTTYEGASFRFVASGLEVTYPPSGWPGLVLVDVTPDWRSASHLRIHLSNPSAMPQDLGIALRRTSNQSNRHDISQHVWLAPGEQTLSVPLAPIIAQIGPLENLHKLVLFLSPDNQQAQARQLLFHRVELQLISKP